MHMSSNNSSVLPLDHGGPGVDEETGKVYMDVYKVLADDIVISLILQNHFQQFPEQIRDQNIKPLSINDYLLMTLSIDFLHCLMRDIRPISLRSLQQLFMRSAINTLTSLNQEDNIGSSNGM